MAFGLGVLLFAVGIMFSIAWHELGHMQAARMTGMRVRRYFVGFGPTIWSFTRPYKGKTGGTTEYGVKAVPLGGFCDIAGMTLLDEVSEDEKPYAMYRQSAVKRIFVLLGGIIMNVILALAIIYGVAIKWGLPDTSVVFTPTVAETACVSQSQNADGTLEPCTGNGPAEQSGVRAGDTFTRFNGVDTPDFQALTREISRVASDNKDTHAAGDHISVPATVDRGGQVVDLDVQVELVERLNTAGNTMLTGAIGIKAKQPEYTILEYNPVTAVGGTAHFAGTMVSQTVEGMIAIPERVPGLVRSIFGGNREQDSPMSVVGASRVGGELVQYEQWQTFWMMLASLNLFLAGFNLLPLPPLDGGHIAVVLWEKIRDFFRRRRGLAPGGPADYTKLMPLTYAATVVLMVFGAMVIVADVVNPIKLF
ncbi:signaling protein [Corynebacterium sp. zg254]|uniref:Zinc metalloprotease Rip1 n=1 Tax=Corynebacterium zhongnanshanii TaxID=2768834 RepID=A0ABQ6VGE9_9CORY|nr:MULTISPECIES: RIP metalloprotease [Corynebacterium]KAB3523340.1 RIP metalloprotease [Corynebacterium zhongnanshanii]MCR5913538.1 signaling protein [Corynebacterium sp. zg254]